MVNPWPRLPREVEDAPFQGTIKVVLDRVCEQTGLVGNVPVHTAFKGPFQHKQLHNPTNQAFISQQLQHSLHSPFSKGSTRPHPLAEGLHNNNCNIQKSTQWPAGDVYVVKVSALRSLLGSLGITKNSRTLVNITSLTHSWTDTGATAHQKAKCHLGACAKMCWGKKTPVFAAQRLGFGARTGREIWKHWIRDNDCCRFMGWDSGLELKATSFIFWSRS